MHGQPRNVGLVRKSTVVLNSPPRAKEVSQINNNCLATCKQTKIIIFQVALSSFYDAGDADEGDIEELPAPAEATAEPSRGPVEPARPKPKYVNDNNFRMRKVS